MTTPLKQKRISENTIEEVKQRTDIVDVVSEHITLKKRGKDYMGLCPFHEEKSPSFSVSPGKQLYHCFGCNASGDAIKFLMELGKQSFTEAVTSLAYRYNIPLGEDAGKPVSAANSRLDNPPQQKGCTLARLLAPATDSPQPQQPQFYPKGVPSNAVSITYEYDDSYGQRGVTRFQWEDTNNPKGHSKTFRQWHIGEDGKINWTKGEPQHWYPYRWKEALDAVEQTSAQTKKLSVLLAQDGEECVEVARRIGAASITFQGSGWNPQEIADKLRWLKFDAGDGERDYLALAFLKDNDKSCQEKAKKLQSACDSVGIIYFGIDPLAICPDLPDKGDIVQILERMDSEEFIQRLEAEIHKAFAARLEKQKEQQQKIDDPDERLRLELLALAKETDPVKRLRKRQELAITYRIKGADLERVASYLHAQTKAPQVEAMGLDQLFDSDIPDLEYLIPGMLPKGDSILLVADPKVGKSLLAYDAAFAVATGESDFLGEHCQQGRVLIVQTDESIQSTKHRLLKRGFRREDTANVRYINRFNISQMAKLEEHLESFRPSLVVIDSLRRINAGREVSENNAEFADLMSELKELLSQYNAAGIIIHHANKNPDALGIQRVRGSSAIAAAVFAVWDFQRIPKTITEGGRRKPCYDPKDLRRTLTVTPRDGEGVKLSLELDLENNHWVCQTNEANDEEARERKSQSMQVLELLSSVSPTGLEAREINEQLGLGRSVYSVLNRLLERRLIGCRASSVDRRRTVYYCHNLAPDEPKDCNWHKGDPPSPPVNLQNVIEYDETTTEQSFESLITVRSQIDRSLITPQSENADVINSDADGERISEIDHTCGRDRGGEGVEKTILNDKELINRTSEEMQRLGWTIQQGRDYLVQAYGKLSRQLLTDEELLEFLRYLESQPTPLEQTVSTLDDDSRLAQDEVTVGEQLEKAEEIAKSADFAHDNCDEECWAFHPRYRDWHYGRVAYRTLKSVGVRFTGEPKPTKLARLWVVSYNRDSKPTHVPTKS